MYLFIAHCISRYGETMCKSLIGHQDLVFAFSFCSWLMIMTTSTNTSLWMSWRRTLMFFLFWDLAGLHCCTNWPKLLCLLWFKWRETCIGTFIMHYKLPQWKGNWIIWRTFRCTSATIVALKAKIQLNQIFPVQSHTMLMTKLLSCTCFILDDLN